MKSWILAFIPTTDEYKEKAILQFMAEGAVILVLSLIGIMVFNHFFNITITVALFIPIIIFLIYVALRHAFSGIQYADVTTDKIYKREMKAIIVKITVFFVTLVLLCLLFEGFDKWLQFVLLTLSVSIVWFLTDFVSLKSSFRKNKDLI